jgi:hypothetical protein
LVSEELGCGLWRGDVVPRLAAVARAQDVYLVKVRCSADGPAVKGVNHMDLGENDKFTGAEVSNDIG